MGMDCHLGNLVFRTCTWGGGGRLRRRQKLNFPAIRSLENGLNCCLHFASGRLPNDAQLCKRATKWKDTWKRGQWLAHTHTPAQHWRERATVCLFKCQKRAPRAAANNSTGRVCILNKPAGREREAGNATGGAPTGQDSSRISATWETV